MIQDKSMLTVREALHFLLDGARPIADSEVAVARRSPKPSMISSGTITIPPPTPNRPLKAPASTPIAAKRIVRFAGTPRY